MMADDPVLLRLRENVRVTGDRFHRVRLVLGDRTAVAAAQGLWDEAAEALRAYESRTPTRLRVDK